MAKRKKKWMQKASKSMKRRGTRGKFTRWCKSQGYGGVTDECIAQGLRSRTASVRKMASFAKAARTVARRKGRKSK